MLEIIKKIYSLFWIITTCCNVALLLGVAALFFMPNNDTVKCLAFFVTGFLVAVGAVSGFGQMYLRSECKKAGIWEEVSRDG